MEATERLYQIINNLETIKYNIIKGTAWNAEQDQKLYQIDLQISKLRQEIENGK
ncbi:MAG: hypothetical protein FWD76_04865 [Firmicutes bacterium]|nr:hypothetical protein [Bacillota bacterium]